MINCLVLKCSQKRHKIGPGKARFVLAYFLISGGTAMRLHLFTAAALITLATVAFAQQSGAPSTALPSGFETKALIKSGKSADGDTLQYPKTDKPEIVAVTGTIQAGGRTPLHQHPIPVFVYVMEGALEVQTEGKEVRRYKTGDSFIESVNRSHQAFNKGNSPTKILVVFVGEEGKPTTIVSK